MEWSARGRRRGRAPGRRRKARSGLGEGGSVSIEAVLWMPLFTFFLLLAVDVSNIYLKQGEAMRILQDGNRALSVNRLTTPAQAQLAIAQRLGQAVTGATVTTAIDGKTIVTTATLPVSAMTMSGSLPFVSGAELTVSARHLVEY